MEENENNETEFSSDYWAKVVKGEIEDEENDNTSSKDVIFRCSKCGFVYDLSNPPKNFLPFNYYISGNDPNTIKCPNCGKKVSFQTITREEYNKIQKKKEEKNKKIEEQKLQKRRENEISNIKDDLKDLVDDLKNRLFNNEITPKAFVSILSYMSRNIVKRYDRHVGVDWIKFRRDVLDISDDVLKVYGEKQKSEDILEEYDSRIEEDELTKAEMKYYIDDDKYAIPDYELRQRIAEYDRQDQKIKKEEYKREIEEKYQNRKNELLQMAQKREERQKLHEIL